MAIDNGDLRLGNGIEWGRSVYGHQNNGEFDGPIFTGGRITSLIYPDIPSQ